MPIISFGWYEVEASVEDEDGYVTRPGPGQDAEYYSVYVRYTDECAHWLADFMHVDDAVLFAEMKGKS